MADFSAERMAEHFVNYLFDEYEGDAKHVRRVAAWFGLLALGIETLKMTWHLAHKRQLVFESGDRRFKVRYKHGIGPGGGGIEFVEISKAQGSPEVGVARQILNLADAEDFYRHPTL